MAETRIKTGDIGDTTVSRADINTGTTGSALITKIVAPATPQGVVVNSSTGVDAGTGDVSLAIDVLGLDTATTINDSDCFVLQMPFSFIRKKTLFSTIKAALLTYFQTWFAQKDNITAGRLWGRYAATVGALQEITPGTGLTLNSTTGVLSTNNANNWGLSGNAGTTAGTNFIGTTDDADLIFKRNTNVVGALSLANVGMGFNSLNAGTTVGIGNTAMGAQALATLTTGTNNCGIGNKCGMNITTGGSNAAIGFNSLAGVTSGGYNMALGRTAGNTALGAATNCSYSVFLGAGTKSGALDATNEIVRGYNTTGAGSNTATLGNSSITKTILVGDVLLGTNKFDISFEFRDITVGIAQTYILDIYAAYSYIIVSAVLETDTGTLTGVAVKIGSTAVTSLSAITVDSTVDVTASTGANAVAVGDRVTLVTSTGYTGSVTALRGKLIIQRT